MKVHVVGPYGHGSLQDDCRVDLLCAELRGVWPGADVAAGASFSPEAQDASIVGGGGVLYRHVHPCGTENLQHVLRYPAAMQYFGKKTFAVAVGVQGLLDRPGLESLQAYLPVFNRMSLLTVRDGESARLLRKAGVSAPILECADLAYLTPVIPNMAGRRHGKLVLGILAAQADQGVTHDDCGGFEAGIAAALEVLKDDFDIHFFLFKPRSDEWPKSFQVYVERTTYEPTRNSIGRFIADLDRVDVVLTTGLHGATLCALKGIPFVAIGAPGEKLDRECRELDHPHFLSFNSSSAQLVQAVREARSNAHELREKLLIAGARRKDLAARSFDALRSLEVSEIDRRHKASWQTASEKGKTLVVWAAHDNYWDEIRPQIEALKSADCLVPFSSGIHDSIFQKRYTLPRHGVMNWAALPEAMRAGLADRYDNVLVCHKGNNASRPANLMEIGAKAGRRAWECRLWTQAFQPIDRRNEGIDVSPYQTRNTAARVSQEESRCSVH